MARKLKTRKEYKIDTVQFEALDPLRDFEGGPIEYWLARGSRYIHRNVKVVFMGIGAVVLIIGGIIGYAILQKKIQEDALKNFEMMMDNPIMVPGAGSTEAALRKLDEYAQNYSGHSAENRAAAKKIEFFVKDSNYAGAAEASATIARSLDNNYLKSYFLIRSASFMEMAGNYSEASSLYKEAVDNVQEQNLLKAVALYGQGRTLIAQKKVVEGKGILKSMMEMKDVQGIDDFRLSASAYILRNTDVKKAAK